MAAEGRNLLEVVLNTDIAKKFNAVDDAVDKIQASMNSAAESAKQFAEALDGINKSFGDKSGFASFAENIQKLIESLNGLNTNTGAKGIEQTKKGIESIGEAAILDIDSVQKLIDAINKIPEAFSKTSSGSSSSGGSKKSNVLDGLLFDTKDLQAKREELAALLAEFETKIKSIGGKFFDVGQLIGTGGIDSAKRLQSVIENLQKSIANTQVDLENTTKRFFSGSFEGKYKEFEKMDAAYIRLQNRLNDLQQKLQSAETLAPLLKEFKAIREEYLQTTADLNTFVQKNNKITEAQKTIEGYKKELEGMANAFERMKASGKAFTSKGGLTDEAQKLLTEKQALEEKIKLYQMSADEAIKQEQKKNAEIEKEEKAASQRLKALYDERLKLEQAIFETRQKANTSQSSDSSYYENLSKLAKNYDDRIKEIDRDIKEIEGDYARAGIEAREAYDTKAIKQAIEQEEKREKAIDKTTKSLEKLKETERKQSEEERNNKIGLLGGDAPRTIREYEIAIKNLRNEIRNLDADTQKGQINEYNKRITEYKKKVDEATGATNRFRQENIKLNNVLQQVAGAFGVYLGVQGLVNFARNVATTTGEFELQHRALQAIIGDIDTANKLWDKTVRLAVKSPFSVKELVTYTKQLAAYRVESDKLYDTTKMLADISSGLGVDMQRLILAYGQVKAANYLRGQELRQFSEAGINILGELAKYFGEIRGQAISTGEVFEMVSKRMVKFEDVAEVLKRLTQEGGTFFNMQEIQAETLQGMMTNLKDSFDIMKNEIGESNRGIIVAFVQTAKYLADNWKTVGNTLKWVSGLVIALNIAMKSARISFMATQAVANGTTIQMTLLTRVLALFNPTIRQAAFGARAFSAAMGSIPGVGIVLAALTALTGVITSLVGKMRMAKEYQEEIGRINTQTALETSKMTSQYSELAKKIKDTNTSEKERAELLSKMKRLYGEILPSHMLEIEYITKEGNAYEDALQGIRAYYQEKRKQKEIEATEKQYGEAVDTNQASAAKQLQKQIKNYTGIQLSIKDINSVLEELAEQLRKGEIQSDKFTKSLARLIKTQTGLDLNLPNLDASRYEIMLRTYDNVREYLESILDYDRQIQEVTSSGEFGGVMANAFETLVTKPAENAIAEYSQHIKGTFVEQGDELAKYTEDAFNHYWEEFKKSPYYKDNPDLQTYFDNLFSQTITPKINASKLTQEVRRIQEKFDEFAEKFNVTNREILKKFLYDGSEGLSEYLKTITTEYENTAQDLRKANENLMSVPPDQLANMQDTEKVLHAIVEWLKAILDPKKTGGSHGNPALQLLNKQIEAIKNAAKQYDEYKKMYEDTRAYEKTKQEVSGLFKELNISDILKNKGAFDENVIKDKLEEWLASSISSAGKGGQQVAQKYISGLQLQFEKENYAKNIVDKFKKDLDNAFDQVSLGEELSKLGIERDFTKILFGIDTKSTEDVRAFVRSWRTQLESKGQFGETAEKEYKAAIEKIDDLEDKAQKERLKKYVNYAKQAMTERARIEVEGLRELADIEKAFIIEIEKAEKSGNKSRADQLKGIMETAIAGSKKATDEKLGKQAWEDFKGSDLYIEMFDDLGNVSTKVIETIQEKIQQLKGSLKGLNPSDLKAITQEINKLEDELIRRNPFQGFIDSWKKVKALKKEGKTEESLAQSLLANDAEIESLNQLIETNEKWLESRRQSAKDLTESEGVYEYNSINISLQKQIDSWKKIIEQKKKDNALTSEDLETYEQFQKAAKSYADYLQSMGSRVAAVFSDIMSNLEAFGGTTTETTKAWGDMGEAIMSIAAMMPSYILLMKAAGVASKEALGVVGWIMIGVEALVALIKGVAGIKNAAIDDEIEGYQKQIDRLSESYDRLERSFDRAWNINKLREYNNEMESNIRNQISLINQQINAEKERKSPDQSVIDDYNKQINDLYDQMEERHDEWLEKVSGFGGESSWGDATQGFIDAWYDAFAETGDGLEGLRENFNEIIENMVKKQAALRLANAILEPLYKKINEAADDGTITNSEMDAIVAKANATFPELNEKLKAFFQSLGVFGEQAAGELDGLQKGIQGVTEQTAEIIASYMNAIRYYVIDNNTKLGQIISALQDSTGTFNPMVAELRNIRQQAEDIRDLLFSWRETGGVPSMRVTIV